LRNRARTQSPHSIPQIYSCANNPIPIYNPPLICVIAHPIPHHSNPQIYSCANNPIPIYKSLLFAQSRAHPIPHHSNPHPIQSANNPIPIYKSPLICGIAHPIPSFKSAHIFLRKQSNPNI
jgi:hypothetical protein